jgi:HK97 family phage major capsid protein
MDLNQLIEQRKVKLSELEGVLGKAKIENREMFTSENEQFDSIKSEIENIDKEIEEKRKTNTKNNNVNIIIKKNNMEQFNLVKAIRNIVEGRNADESTLKMLEAGKQDFAKAGLSYRGQLVLPMEYRDYEGIGANVGAGTEAIATDKLSLLPYLRANSVLVGAGATLLTGLVGDISIPVLSTGATANWKSEIAVATDAGQGFDELTMTPKRITAYYDVSKQFLLQDSVAAAQMLQSDLMAAVNDLFEATVLGVSAGSSTQPAGIFYNVDLAFSGVTTFANMVAMESEIAGNNALRNGACYILHPSSVGKLKTTQKGSGIGFIAENSTINGYKYLTTTNIPGVDYNTAKYGAFGVFNDLVIGNWGGLDLTIDPYSRSLYGQVRLVINFYIDAIVRREASF